MAFIKGNVRTKKERFSLLLLEPGEIYFEDYSVICEALHEPTQLRSSKGMLKICSKSVIFDPKDETQPILKFLYRDIKEIKEWESPNNFYKPDASLMLDTQQVVEMKAANQIAPYLFKRDHMKYIFRLEFSQTADCVPQMCQLLRASTLPIADQTAMISAIVTHRQHLVPFDKSWLENLYEDIVYESQCDLICPLVVNPGRIMLTTERLYFQPFNNVDPEPVTRIKLGQIQRVIKRRFLLRHVGLEIFCTDQHLYLAFKTSSERENLYSALIDQVKIDDLVQQNMTLKWQNGVISNFEYLVYLNSLADRSTNDLTQYPVFPWVITDFTSKELDLTQESVFRDLSKPIGALNDERLQRLLTRYHEMSSPRFLYGSHYSTPGYVLYYLVRAAPEYMLCLQNGKFDQPDRMFNSVADAWTNCQTSYSDFKELVPEFFEGDGEYLRNSQGINFGLRQDGSSVGDVGLPPWAKDPSDFIRRHREALESDHVSKHLHQWIDLIFGFKQQGIEAEKSHNLFYHLTYEGAIDLDSITDLDERSAVEQQIMEFGQTPKKLFTTPHPARHAPVDAFRNAPVDTPQSDQHALMEPVINKHLIEYSSQITTDNDINTDCYTTVDNFEVSTGVQMEPPVCPGCHEVMNSQPAFSKISEISTCCEFKLHRNTVSALKWDQHLPVTYSGDQDGCVKMYSWKEHQQLHSVNISSMKLSSLALLHDSLLMASWDNYLYQYSFEYGRLLHSILAHDDAVTCLTLSDDQRHLVTGSWDSTVRVWDSSKNGQFILKAQLDHEAGVECVDMSHDSKQVVTATGEGVVTVWDVTSQTAVLNVEPHQGAAVVGQRLNNDCTQVVSVSDDNSVTITDIQTGAAIFTSQLTKPPRCVCWHGDVVAIGTNNGGLQIWDVTQGKLRNELDLQDGVTSISVSSSGSVATGGASGSVTLLHT